MPPKGSLKRRRNVKSASFKRKKRSYSTIRKRSYKGRKSAPKRSYKKRSYKRKSSRKALPGSTGRTVGSYRKMLNVNLFARRELGMLRSTTPGRILPLSLVAGTSTVYSMFFYANSTNVGLINGILPTSVAVLPPTGLVEEVYSKFYNSMVMYNKIGIRISRTDANKAYGAMKIALTPIQYSDFSSVLTAAPGPTTQWVGSTPTLKFANQCDMPHTIVRNMNGAASDALNSAYISSSIRPEYLYNQPGWQTTPDSAVPSRLGFSEQNGVPIALSCAVVWVLSLFYESPTTTDISLLAIDIHETWKLKAWDAVPAFLIAENKQRATDAIIIPQKAGESKSERKEDDEMDEEFERLAVTAGGTGSETTRAQRAALTPRMAPAPVRLPPPPKLVRTPR